MTTGTIVVAAQKNVFGRVVAGILGTVGGLTLLGLITSMTYNGPLGLVGRFANESAFGWPVWGFRSLIAVIGELIIFSLTILVVSGVLRLAYATVGPFRRLCDPVIARARRLSEPIRTAPVAMIAPGVLLVQLIAFAFLVWRFQSIVSGLDSFLMRGSPADFWGLGLQNRPDQHLLLQFLSADLLIFGAVWYRLLKSSRERKEQDGRPAMWAASPCSDSA